MEVDLDQLDVKDYNPATYKLELSPSENQILNQMEDVNDSLNKAVQKTRAKQNRNAVNIAFMDMS